MKKRATTIGFFVMLPAMFSLLTGYTQTKRIELSTKDSDKVAVAYEYSCKNNPAVELMKQVIAHKNENRIENRPAYKAKTYEKLTLALDEFDSNDTENQFIRLFPFLRNHTEASEFTGNPVLTLSLREKCSDKYFHRSPHWEKTIVTAERHIGVDESFDDNRTLTSNLEEMFKSINVLDNDITILQSKFVSPLSSVFALSYYEYEIVDTVVVDGISVVNLSFMPVNRQSYGFTGYLQVTLDGSYGLLKISMTTSRNINLNWVDKMCIVQSFNKMPDGTHAIGQEDIYAIFRTSAHAKPPLYAHLFRSFNYSDSVPEIPDSIAQITGKILVLPDANKRNAAFWLQHRPRSLSEQENQLDIVLVLLKDDPVYRGFMKILEVLVSGYIPTRFDKYKSYFDFGPVGSTFSSNLLEGFRLRIGGVTTARLHPQWFLGGYTAYGFKDKKWKYQLRLSHSFEPRKHHEQEWPVHNLTLTHRYDVYIPGAYSPFDDSDNLFYSLKPGVEETQMQYVRSSELRYAKEWRSNFSVNLWLRHTDNQAAGDLVAFATSTVGLQLRYAPDEKIHSGRDSKPSAFQLNKDAPVFTLSHQSGFKGIFGSDFSYNHSELNVEKRIWLSSFGYIDANLRAAKVWDKAPFPLLIFPNTNQSLFIRSGSFMLMRSMEFISDNYAAFFASYYSKGWIMHQIPLIKRLKLREVF
ncbi:MAG: DUF5686 family protein, partial [Candidatus Symbiothrix sp.]|nr:DUF5686 family protein [Candidatus Symbiothrix sp.]